MPGSATYSAVRDMVAWMKNHVVFCTAFLVIIPEVGAQQSKTVMCGNVDCEMLPKSWAKELQLGMLGDTHWLRRRSQECKICAAERKRRCCILNSSDLSMTLEDARRFDDAPYIHAFNEPKYHAAQRRALRFGLQKNERFCGSKQMTDLSARTSTC